MDSFITKLEWAIGTTPGGSELLPFTNLSLGALTASKGGLASGTSVFVTVRPTNGAGLKTTSTLATSVTVK